MKPPFLVLFGCLLCCLFAASFGDYDDRMRDQSILQRNNLDRLGHLEEREDGLERELAKEIDDAVDGESEEEDGRSASEDGEAIEFPEKRIVGTEPEPARLVLAELKPTLKVFTKNRQGKAVSWSKVVECGFKENFDFKDGNVITCIRKAVSKAGRLDEIGKLVVIAHGYNEMFKRFKKIFWEHVMAKEIVKHETNDNIVVLAVEWASEDMPNFLKLASATKEQICAKGVEKKAYTQFARATKVVGKFLSAIIQVLTDKDAEKSREAAGKYVPKIHVHAIGMSLGAQIVGNMDGVKVERITGLDPAGPCFDIGTGPKVKKGVLNHVVAIPLEVLGVDGTVERDRTGAFSSLHKKNDIAFFVDVWHTNGRQLGSNEQRGDVDIYFGNAGEKECMAGMVQKTFSTKLEAPIIKIGNRITSMTDCLSHLEAPHQFIQSIRKSIIGYKIQENACNIRQSVSAAFDTKGQSIFGGQNDPRNGGMEGIEVRVGYWKGEKDMPQSTRPQSTKLFAVTEKTQETKMTKLIKEKFGLTRRNSEQQGTTKRSMTNADEDDLYEQEKTKRSMTNDDGDDLYEQGTAKRSMTNDDVDGLYEQETTKHLMTNAADDGLYEQETTKRSMTNADDDDGLYEQGTTKRSMTKAEGDALYEQETTKRSMINADDDGQYEQGYFEDFDGQDNVE